MKHNASVSVVEATVRDKSVKGAAPFAPTSFTHRFDGEVWLIYDFEFAGLLRPTVSVISLEQGLGPACAIDGLILKSGLAPSHSAI